MGYIKVRFKADDQEWEAWQVLNETNTELVGYYTLEGMPMEIPEVHECTVITGEIVDSIT